MANAGVLLARVIYVKPGLTRRFVILDAAMNDLIRPALYEAWHEIVTVREPAPTASREPADVVGPICESSDMLALARPLPPVGPGDLLAILSAGAYGAVMSSSYNTRLLVPEVLVQGEEFAIVRRRPSYEELLARGENGIHEKISAAIERMLLPLVLQHAHGHQSQASEILGLNRATLRHKLRSLGLAVDKTVTEENPERD